MAWQPAAALIPGPLPTLCILCGLPPQLVEALRPPAHCMMSREFCNMFYLLAHYADTPTIGR